MKLLKKANPVNVGVNVGMGAVGLVGTAVGVAETLTRETAHLARSGLHRLVPEKQSAGPEPYAATDAAGEPADAARRTTRAAAAGDALPKEPSIVLAEPHAPEEPPVDVVGEALAAEAAQGDREIPLGAGVAHEPRVASRDEEHGDAPLQRVEADEIDDEVTAALEGDDDPQQD